MEVPDVFILGSLLPNLGLFKVELLQLGLLLTNLFLLEDLGLRKLLTASFPELLEVFLLLILLIFFHFALLDLMLAGLLDGCLELSPASLLLLKETLSLLLGLGHLLAQDLVLFVLDLSEIECLLLDHLLADVLLLLEALGLAVLLHLVDVLFLFGILILDALVLLLPALDFLLICFQVLVGRIKILSCASLLRATLEFGDAGCLQVLAGLALDQLTLEDVILELLYVSHLRLMQLVLDHLGGILLSLVHLLHPVLHAFVVLLHLGDIILQPALLDGLVLLQPPLFELKLRVSLLEDIAHEHLRVEGFHFVLGLIGLLGRVLQGLTALLLVEGFFLLVNTSSCKLKVSGKLM